MTSNPLAAEVGTTRPIIGWRAWRVAWGGGIVQLPEGRAKLVSDTGPRLISWTNGYEWPPFRALTAAEGATGACRVTSVSHPSRAAGCHCGVYAFRGKRKLISGLAKEFHGESLIAFGRVSLWGNWVKGTKGWRAEYAYPYDIKLVNTIDPDLARAVAEAYAIDVDYGDWNPAAELSAAIHDCDTEGHAYGIENVCVTCGITREQADKDSSVVRARRLGISVEPPDFQTREEALDWYRDTTYKIMQEGLANGEPEHAQLHVDAISDLMRPILHGKFKLIEAAPTPRYVSRTASLLDRGIPPQA